MVGMMQQPLSANGCERYRNQQFGIIRQAVTLISIRPRPIKDEFAVRVRFEVTRGTADEIAIQVHSEMARCPAGFGAATATFFKRRQEFMTQTRII